MLFSHPFLSVSGVESRSRLSVVDFGLCHYSMLKGDLFMTNSLNELTLYVMVLSDSINENHIRLSIRPCHIHSSFGEFILYFFEFI